MGLGISGYYNVLLTKETANEICLNFTQQEGVIGSAEDGKLVCEVTSFDSTQNIIIKMNNGVDE